MKRAASALAALATATVALAQQTAPPTPAEPRTSATPQEQTTRMSEADKQALMNKCVTQVQAANPNVPQKDVRTYCDQEIKNIASPR